MRAHLLATTAAVALLAATSAYAQNATWNGPGAEWTIGGNWSTGAVPVGTATFAGATPTSITISANTTINTMQFAAGAPAYTFTNGFGGSFFNIVGAGIVNNSAFAPHIINIFSLTFSGQAGNANFTNDGGTLIFSNTTTTVSGTIDGSTGQLLVTGIGNALTLTGNNPYTGLTTVSNGNLIVDGSIASSMTIVNSNSTLSGSGTVRSTTINAGGFLIPGPVVAGMIVPGTLTVAGNLAFQSGAFYVVQVNPTTASTTNVSGTASLAGTVAAVFAPGSYVSRSYTILTADGGRAGTFDAFATFGLPAGFGTRVNYTGNTAVLNLRAQLVPEPEPPTPTPPTLPTRPTPPIPPISGLPPIPGLSPIPGLPPTAEQPPAPPPPFTVNQLNVGHAIDNFFDNGGALPPAFLSLFNLTGGNLTTALDQLSGEPATGAQKVAFQLTNQFLDLMLDPFVDGRCGIGRTDYPPLVGFERDCETRPSALGFAPERETMPPAIALAYASVLKEPRAPLAPVYEPRWTAWAGAYGGSNRTTGDLAVIGSHDLSARTVGGAAGLDYHLTPNTVVGFALGGGGTDWSLSQGLGGG
jgi:autotransporter-associated beta strand protein